MDQSLRRPSASRLLPNLHSHVIVQTISDLVYGEMRDHRRTILFTNDSSEAEFLNPVLRRLGAHSMDSAYEPSKAWIDRVVKDDKIRAVSMPLYVASVGIDLSVYDTLVFLCCPMNYGDLVQAGTRIARKFRMEDLSFKKWYTVFDANKRHSDAEARIQNVEWMNHYLSDLYCAHYHVIAADSEEEAG